MWNSPALPSFGNNNASMDNFIFAHQSTTAIIVSYGAGLTAEFIFAIIRKHTINEGFLFRMLIPQLSH
jgi:Na+-transporting NADH:ubiquinone oxidoreductase subunit B